MPAPNGTSSQIAHQEPGQCALAPQRLGRLAINATLVGADHHRVHASRLVDAEQAVTPIAQHEVGIAIQRIPTAAAIRGDHAEYLSLARIAARELRSELRGTAVGINQPHLGGIAVLTATDADRRVALSVSL